jgi:hypothetical protein
MTRNTWVVAVALAFPIASCTIDRTKPDAAGTPRPSAFQAAAKLPAHCSSGQTECVITVRVGPRCHITMSHDVYVVAPHPGGVDMLWRLQGDAEFAKSNPIDFKSPGFAAKAEYYGADNPKGVFLPSTVKTLSDKEHRKRNLGKPGKYYYTVNVVQDGKPCKEYDPGVVNQ